MMAPEGKDILIPGEFEDVKRYQNGDYRAMGPNHTPRQGRRMIDRHGRQLKELLTRCGQIDMMCLDQWMAGDLWPDMRRTLLALRKIQPDVMFRARAGDLWKEGETVRFTRSKDTKTVYGICLK